MAGRSDRRNMKVNQSLGNPIFKANALQKNKTLNEDDEEIISKWRSSKMI
jgi:hypothetical protein